MQSALPYPPPKVVPGEATGTEDNEIIRIRKLVEYVVRNGPDFEEKVRQKEANNPKFSFLQSESNPAGYLYYRWFLFCGKHFYTPEQIEQIEYHHCLRILPVARLGQLEMTQEDYQQCHVLLANNNGTKDMIKAIRSWTIARAHSITAIAFAFLDFIVAQRHTVTQQGIPPDKVFQKLLHTVYVLNDVVFNHAQARTEGPYTMLIANSEAVNLVSVLLPYLPNILRQSYEAATNDAERGKIERVIRIWGEKGLVPPGEVSPHPHPPPTLPHSIPTLPHSIPCPMY